MFDFAEVQKLRDDVLIERLTSSVREDRRLTVRLLIELGEVQARGLYREFGFSTMFEFATRRLGMSEAEAWLRTRVARLARDVPAVLEMLERNEVTLSTLALVAPHMSPPNLELLQAARFKSKRQVEVLLAARFPKPDAPDSVRRLPSTGIHAAGSGSQHAARPSARATQRETAPLSLFAGSASPVQGSTPLPDLVLATSAPPMQISTPLPDRIAPTSTSPTQGSTPPPDRIPPTATSPTQGSTPPPDRIPPTATSPVQGSTALPDLATSATPVRGTTDAPARAGQTVSHTPLAKTVLPLSTGRYKISFTGSQRVCDLLREAQDLRGHRGRSGDLERLFERALELLVAEERKRKFALTLKPRAPRSVSRARKRARYIPHAVRREVWKRDDGRCCFVSAEGRRCVARRGLDFHHVVPFARGGSSRADNIQLLCHAHNLLQAERDYGRGFMRRSMERHASRASGSPGIGSSVIRDAPATSLTDASAEWQLARPP